MGLQLREGLHGGQGGDGEQLALDVGEDARGEGLVEDPVLEDVEQLGVRGVRLGLHPEQPGEGLTCLRCQRHGGLLTMCRWLLLSMSRPSLARQALSRPVTGPPREVSTYVSRSDPSSLFT